MQSFIVKESLNSVKVFWLEQDKLIKALKRKAKETGENDPNILKIVLFGSLAERRGVPGSRHMVMKSVWCKILILQLVAKYGILMQ